MRRLARWLGATVGRRRFERRLADEMAEHLACRADELVARGLPRPEAQRRARLELGGSVEAFKEECREARRLGWGDELARNIRHALRVLRRSPGLSASIALTLGLCLGANTVVLSVIDAVLLRPLPYPAPERLAMVRQVFAGGPGGPAVVDAHDGRSWQALRDGARGLDVAVYSGWPSGANALAGDRALYLHQQRVGAGFFRVLGVEPLLGRGFTAAEDVPGGPAVVVISRALWTRWYQADPAVIGRSLTLRGAPHEIVGVMPAGFRTELEADVWTPLRPSTTGEGAGTNYGIVARLDEGVSWPAARAELAALAPPAAEGDGAGARAHFDIVPLQEALTGGLETRLLVTWAAALLVLAVGAINVAGLLLAHGARRAAEIRTRLALGGDRGAVVRQLLTESLAFALLGGAVGLVLGTLGLRLLSGLARDVLGIWQPLALDGRITFAVLVLVLLTVLATGLYPARLATREAPAAPGGGERVAGLRNPWPRRILVSAQLALVVALLVGAGLVLRTLEHLRALPPGFDPHGVVAARVSLQDARYATAEHAARLFEALRQELARQPGIEAAAAGLSVPYERPLNLGFALPGDTDPPAGPRITNLVYVTPGYFETLRVPRLAGRLLATTDGAGNAPVAVINQAFARAYLEGKTPVGQRLRIGGAWREIVGVVSDTQQTPSWGDDTPLGVRASVFVPVAQTPSDLLRLAHTWFEPSLLARGRGGEAATGELLRQAIHRADARLPLAELRSLTALRERVLAPERFQALLLGLAAAIALVLAAVGLAGLIAGSVAERTRELGIRMALGASAARTLGGVVLSGLGIAAAGLGAGLAAAALLVRGLSAFVFGVGLFDAVTFTGVSVLLLAVALLASLLPALRVLRLDVTRTLRVS